MKQRLNVILKKCKNYKFRKGFIKYLSSLDFEEFEQIYNKYVRIIIRLIIRYRNKKIKFLSKDWFKNQILENKWDRLHTIFVESNFAFVTRVNNNDRTKNNKTRKILTDIDVVRETLKNINENVNAKTIEITDYSTQEEIFNFYVLLVDSIYLSLELEKLKDELYKITF
jgi:hypothetical protein